MTINERIRWFRKDHLHISQAEFAKVIGMKQTSVSTFERNGASVSNQIVKSICMAFSVNEDWLCTGKGEMLPKADTFSLDQYARERGASELELELAKVYFGLPKDVRSLMLAKLKELMGSDSEAAAELAPDLKPDRPLAVSPPDSDAAKRAEWEREAEAIGEQSKALTKEQYLSEKLQESQASSARESGAG